MKPIVDRTANASGVAYSPFRNPGSEMEGTVDETEAAARILIVEDDALIALYLQNTLRRLGFDVVGMVPSGEEALREVKACAERGPDVRGRSKMFPDLVLMDINLAGELDGIETAAQIQSQFDIPVIFMTGYSEHVLQREVKLTKPYAYLSKPVNEWKLCDAIEMMLNRRELGGK